MVTTTCWTIYGASGYTGSLIAREARRRGLTPMLAGRSQERLASLGQELDLPWRCFPLDDQDALRAGIAGSTVVVHCAGPFVRTSRAMVDACLAERSHYLDITGEIEVFEAIISRGREARRAGVALVPGVGFDVVPTDCLAARLAAVLPGATHLDLAFASQRGAWSAGTTKTMLESMPRLGAVRLDGRIIQVGAAHDVREIPFASGQRLAATIPWGDVSTAFHTTGIPNIRVYMGVNPRLLRRLRRQASLARLLAFVPLKRTLQWWVGRTMTGPDEAARRSARASVWGRAWQGGGGAVSGTLETPEGYTLTALAAVECVVRTLAGGIEPGSWTPAGAFGSDLVDALPGVVVGPLEREEAPK